MRQKARVNTHLEPTDLPARLCELAWVFLKLGVIGFGGPAAHIALMEEEAVRRRKWLSHQAFLDLLGATNLIPGPNSTELAIHLGRLRAGTAGLLVAGVCFIVPAMLIVLGCGWAYVRWGQLPAAGGVLYGVKAVVLAVVLQAIYALAKSALRTRFLALLGGAALLTAVAGGHELLILLVAGAIGLARTWRRPGPYLPAFALPLPWLGTALAAAPATYPYSLPALAWFFLKVGSVLFGSGYVLLAFLRADLVERWHWLTEAQLLDAIAIGQLTPGPVFTTATFIGYLLGGWPAGLVATGAIFLPAFVFVALSARWVERLRESPAAAGFLDGLNVASLALMAATTLALGRHALTDVPTVAATLLSLLLLVRFRTNSAWLILAGAGFGWLAHR